MSGSEDSGGVRVRVCVTAAVNASRFMVSASGRGAHDTFLKYLSLFFCRPRCVESVSIEPVGGGGVLRGSAGFHSYAHEGSPALV